MASVSLGTPDVIVIGAGPAGCAAASVLARCGHRVVVIDRPSLGRPALAESIPPSAHRILRELGMKSAVDAEGFHPWLGNTVWWGSDDPRIESFAPGESGYQVERDRFDGVLREVARKAGAELVEGVVRDGDALEARIVLDCSGQAGVIARKGYREAVRSHHTIALAAVWTADTPWPDGQRGHTLVASHADGWAWSVPISADTRYVTVMVDPERSHLTRGVPSLDVYRAELEKVTPFAPLIERSTLVEGPWGKHASLYTSRQFGGPGFLLVGDAASFIDPLSSFGVKKALASGWLAAITANTILETPEMAEEARRFYEQRERAVVESFRRQTTRFAAGATTGAHPFWEARGDLAFDTQRELRSAHVARPGSQGREAAALDDLRRREHIRLEPGAQVRTAPKAAIRDRLIVMDEHLFLPEWPDGVRYLRNVDLLMLLRLAPAHSDVGGLYEALFREQPGVSLPDFLGALSALIACGALRHRAL